MTTSSSRVQVGALQAAWDQATALLDLRSGSKSPDDLTPVFERIAYATAQYGTVELERATMMLMCGALEMLGAGQPNGTRFHEQFTETLLAKLSSDELAEPTDLPTVQQVVQIGFAEGDPLAWREKAGPIPASEPRTMTCALALIASFVDHVDGAGACERKLLTTIGHVYD